MVEKINKTEEEWRKVLSHEQYHILREKGTERPFTGKYYNNKETGLYLCGACGTELFSSDTKYDSGSGWPSFYAPVKNDIITEKADHSLMKNRTEVVCSCCGSHLGHVFNDGPKPTGQRYCINSASLIFKEEE